MYSTQWIKWLSEWIDLVVSWRLYQSHPWCVLMWTSNIFAWGPRCPCKLGNHWPHIETSWVHTEKGKISLPLIYNTFLCFQVTCSAIQRNEDDRAQYKYIIGQHYRPEQLVFTDESSLNQLTTRHSYAWSYIGNRARRRDFFIRGRRFSLVPALSLDGILHLEVIEGSFTADRFNTFVHNVLDRMNPWPQQNSVLVCDNASIHHSEELHALIENR